MEGNAFVKPCHAPADDNDYILFVCNALSLLKHSPTYYPLVWLGLEVFSKFLLGGWELIREEPWAFWPWHLEESLNSTSGSVSHL